MALLQSQTVSLPKLKINNQKIPIVQHIIKNDDIEETVVIESTYFIFIFILINSFSFILQGWSSQASWIRSND